MKKKWRKSGDEPEEEKHWCIYIQKSTAVAAEREMVRVVTALEKYLEVLQELLNAVKDMKREYDQPCIMEHFTLFNIIRHTLFELGESIFVWQQGFTRVVRPILVECDYMKGLKKRLNFVNMTLLRRVFNFQLGKGNVLLLPLPNLRTIEANVVSKELAEQIREFAAPEIDKVIGFYQLLINSLPTNEFNCILPIEQWLQSRWIPKIRQIQLSTAVQLNQGQRYASQRVKGSPSKLVTRSASRMGGSSLRHSRSTGHMSPSAILGESPRSRPSSARVSTLPLATASSKGVASRSTKATVLKFRDNEQSATQNPVSPVISESPAGETRKVEDVREGANSVTSEGTDPEVSRLIRQFVPKTKLALTKIELEDSDAGSAVSAGEEEIDELGLQKGEDVKKVDEEVGLEKSRRDSAWTIDFSEKIDENSIDMDLSGDISKANRSNRINSVDQDQDAGKNEVETVPPAGMSTTSSKEQSDGEEKQSDEPERLGTKSIVSTTSKQSSSPSRRVLLRRSSNISVLTAASFPELAGGLEDVEVAGSCSDSATSMHLLPAEELKLPRIRKPTKKKENEVKTSIFDRLNKEGKARNKEVDQDTGPVILPLMISTSEMRSVFLAQT